ncbi:hypothetical protein [Paracraurococcus lichenis]|uniref:Uncharacterized protein n=1 Tax=Paracraurococcus lichenis TaxID=3064888 RepID=A0ABT9E853_9PROT|nr:hypothetical protein [Paracraurococcus sp. LOR1-02]MDO9712302.1 hypothetical protein [Paracraurococcus sp. LOR1-02]
MSELETDVAVLLTAVEGLRVRERTRRARLAAIEQRLSSIEMRLSRLDDLESEIEDDKLRLIRPDTLEQPAN